MIDLDGVATARRLAAFVTSIREVPDAEKAGVAHFAVDWLRDQGEHRELPTTADVCLLYARPPAWERAVEGPASIPPEVYEAMVRQRPELRESPEPWRFLGAAGGGERAGIHVRCFCCEPIVARWWQTQAEERVCDRPRVDLTAMLERWQLRDGSTFECYLGQCGQCRRVVWLSRSRVEKMPPHEDDSLRPLLTAWVRYEMGELEAADRIESLGYRRDSGRNWCLGWRDVGVERRVEVIVDNEGWARRELKRIILSQSVFGDISYVVRFTVSLKAMRHSVVGELDYIKSQNPMFRLDRKWEVSDRDGVREYRQRLRPVDLLPAERDSFAMDPASGQDWSANPVWRIRLSPDGPATITSGGYYAAPGERLREIVALDDHGSWWRVAEAVCVRSQRETASLRAMTALESSGSLTPIRQGATVAAAEHRDPSFYTIHDDNGSGSRR